jgi:hypothetical protein
MEFSTTEVANVARMILEANPNGSNGHFLQNLAVQAGAKRQLKIKTDNACVIAMMKTARESKKLLIKFYADSSR